MQVDAQLQSPCDSDFVGPSPYSECSFKLLDSRQQAPSDLLAKLEPVQYDGSFRVRFSDEIYLLDKNSIIYKGAVEVRVIWLNEAILEQRDPKPSYQVELVEITQFYMEFRLLFDEPDRVSLGSKPDVV